MRQIIYVKYNRTRSEKFQLKTAIVRENGALSVEKTGAYGKREPAIWAHSGKSTR